MNRFEYIEARLHENESFVKKEHNIKLYDGDEKTQFEEGEIVLTTHRLFWGRPGEIAQASRTLCLGLHYVISVSEEIASSYVFGRKTRLILHLQTISPQQMPNSVFKTNNSYIKISGKHGVSSEFSMALRETINARIWLVMPPPHLKSAPPPPTQTQTNTRLTQRTGIGGIERLLEAKTRETNDNIALAFQDLNVLMAMAKDMINISKVISDKIRDHHGDISEDETVRFKSYLMSLGINDPVTRENFNSNTQYFHSLATQISEILLVAVEEHGGMMSLADAYCRINRARGYELLSPEDVLHACEQLNGDLILRTFPSGARVLQLTAYQDEQISNETMALIQAAETESLAVEELAQQLGISLLLAKERLLTAERFGKICRDQCISGLRFYINYFLLPRNVNV